MKKINKKILLLLIILFAGFLRFYRLADYPALNADEAAIGYNAYSLIQTGEDEHGNAWPIHFQSFNDYKPGLYFYLVLPFVRFLGLNEWAVRIPGALLGVATVLALFFLVKELFKDETLAYVASFFLAISPWHIHFSRGGWEVNAATFFITAGIWLFLKA
ncbi:glycosyltransferase family 39 protein, partial [Candidatus Woesebacteria bacterium]|nr:glycosyltransferase family 39 protein [Candidatus Woesebacteria bacterium]